MRTARGFCLPMLLVAACNGDGGPSSFGTLPVTTVPAEQSSGSTGGDGTDGSTTAVPEASTSAGSSAGTTLALDVGAPDLGAAGPEGCGGKIDFLFVIARGDAEATMQDKLLAALPKFIATIESRFADFDYHIMVVDSDEYWGLDYCNQQGCDDPFCAGIGYPCDAIDSITWCDAQIGAGTIFNAGEGTLNKPCGVAEGKRYLDRDQPDFEETFACVARVGYGGKSSMAWALVDALTPGKTGECNAGFLRDDALLFVSFIARSTDSGSPGTPEDWAQAVIDAKHGDAGAAVMFSIGPLSALGKPDFEACSAGKYFSLKICDLLEHFPYRMVADEAIPDYAVAFEQATELVFEACSAFVPR
jgi:hypothetical protein